MGGCITENKKRERDEKFASVTHVWVDNGEPIHNVGMNDIVWDVEFNCWCINYYENGFIGDIDAYGKIIKYKIACCKLNKL